MIEIKNLKKFYENFEINIDLSIKKGEIFGIIGQSASGKTSTLELISDRLSDEYNIATIFQDFNLLNNLNIFENVALPLRINNTFNEKKVLDVLDFVSLVEKKHDYPSQLSGGQRQRVAIARALLQNPDILLCDEITSSLDKKIAKDICDLFKKLDCTIIFVTHELDIAKYICDRVAIIEQGRVKDIIKVNKQDIFVQDYYTYAKEFLND